MGIDLSSGLLLLIIVLGFVLQKSGRPYSDLVMGVHKLIALGLVVILTIFFYQFLKISPQGFLFYALLVLGILSVLALFISGGLLGLGKIEVLMRLLHKISSTFFILALAGLFYLFIKG